LFVGIAGFHMLAGHTIMPVNLADEGFLWYGAQRVLHGEIPIKDFQSYDPGRYYFVSLFMQLRANTGLLSVHIALAAVQAVGLLVAILLVAKSLPAGKRMPSAIYLLLSALTIVAWMYPRHKLFDLTISVVFIATIAWFACKPTTLRYFLTGAVIGFAAVFGRNHGVYGLFASLCAIVVIKCAGGQRHTWLTSLSAFMGGIVIGFAPVLLYCAYNHEFAEAFWRSIVRIINHGSTNLALPIPWPWTVDFEALPVTEALRQFAIGCFFLALVVFPLVAGFALCRLRVWSGISKAVLLACLCLSLPYGHYAFSRADVGHLAHGIFPMLIGSMVVAAQLKPGFKWAVIAILTAASVGAMHAYHPALNYTTIDALERLRTQEDILLLDAPTSELVKVAQHLTEAHVPESDEVLFLPRWPGLYAILRRKSPIHEIYALLPADEQQQQSEVRRLENSKPALVLLDPSHIDADPRRRFEYTHPALYRWIENNYTDIEVPGHPHLKAFIRRKSCHSPVAP
jgi:hypothetical protein